MRRLPAGLATAALVVALAAGCSDDGDSGAFCERLGETEPTADVLAALDASDPAGVEDTIQESLDDFEALEADAPGEIRDDVARLRQGVELILGAVEDNPDDLSAARAAIAGELDELSGLAQAGQAVADYAEAECGIDLGEGDG